MLEHLTVVITVASLPRLLSAFELKCKGNNEDRSTGRKKQSMAIAACQFQVITVHCPWRLRGNTGSACLS